MHTYAHHVVEESVNQASISHQSQADSDIEYETGTNSSCPGKGRSQTRLFSTREKPSYSLSHQPSVPVWLAFGIGKKFIRDTAAIATDCTNLFAADRAAGTHDTARLPKFAWRGSRDNQELCACRPAAARQEDEHRAGMMQRVTEYWRMFRLCSSIISCQVGALLLVAACAPRRAPHLGPLMTAAVLELSTRGAVDSPGRANAL